MKSILRIIGEFYDNIFHNNNIDSNEDVGENMLYNVNIFDKASINIVRNVFKDSNINVDQILINLKGINKKD